MGLMPKPRILAIAALVLIIVWIAVVAGLYRSALRSEPAPVSPARLVAMVNLAETLGETGRADLVRFLEASNVSLRFGAGDTPLRDKPPPPDMRSLSADDYVAAVAPRPLEIVTPVPVGLRRIAPAYFLKYPPITVFHVSLQTGGTLTLTARSPLMSSILGLPHGSGAGMIGSLLALVVLIGVIRATRSLERMAEALDRTDLSNTPEKLPPYRGFSPEVSRLVDAYNRLQDRLRLLLQNRMALIGGISHDVRTFATRLRLRVDSIEDEAERVLAVADIADMIRLLDDALIASRAGAGELTEELLDVGDVLAQEFAARQEAGAEIELSLAGDETLQILGDRLAVRRIVTNLVDNGLKYGKRVRLSGRVADNQVEIVVEDEGPGIADDVREAVMEPFFRMETSRSRDTGGAGLGLAVVKTLTEGQGGTITLEQRKTGGCRFIVRLPEFRV